MATFVKNCTLDLFSHLHSFELCSFGSGSSGNCYFVGNAESALLVDAGLNGRNIVKALQESGKNIRQIQGILITHDHIDHIKGLPDLTQRFNVPVYVTARSWEAILNNRYTRNVRPGCIRIIEAEKPFHIGSFSITPFPVDHDAADAHGFHISNSHSSLSIATDLGTINPIAEKYLKASHFMVLESNYDEQMLREGPYPQYLQDRIRSNKGHLSNDQTADFLSKNHHPNLKQVFLAHLSEHNNSPEKVSESLQNIINGNQHLFQFTVLERKKRSVIFRL